MKNISCFLGSLALFPILALGAGSVTRPDLEAIFQSNPALTQSLTDSLVLAEVGTATLVGNHVGNLGGARIGPYEFEATLKNPPGQGSKVKVTLHTAVKFFDASGQMVRYESILPQTRGMTLSESFERFEVAAAPVVALPTFNTSLAWADFKLPLGEGESGNYRKGSLDGELKEMEINYDEGEHIGWTFKIVFDENKFPSQVVASSSTWKFVAPEKTEDEITTRVLDYQGGKLVKVSVSEKTNDLGQPVDFENLMVTSVAANRVYLVALQMKGADSAALAELVQDAIDAQVRLTEPLVSADDPRWKPIDLKGQLYQVDSSFTTSAAALYFVRHLRLLPAATAAEQPAHLWADLLSLKDGVTTVLVTASGYQDDELEGERFLVAISQAADGWQLRGVGSQLKKWRGDDWE